MDEHHPQSVNPVLQSSSSSSLPRRTVSLSCKLNIRDLLLIHHGSYPAQRDTSSKRGQQQQEIQFKLSSSVRFPEGFLVDLGRAIDELNHFDKITIELVLFSSSSHQGSREHGDGAERRTERSVNEDYQPARGGTIFSIIHAKHLEIILSKVYIRVETEKLKRNKRLIDVDVIIDRFSDHLHRSQSSLLSTTTTTTTRSSLSKHDDDDEEEVEKAERQEEFFSTLALGGTFDHLHSGHKILLTVACWLAIDKLLVGITDDELLKTKKYSNHLESLEQRTQRVQDFIRRVRPIGLSLETPAIKDIYGPTAYEPEIDAILVTRETVSGADSIDEIRRKNRLKPLQRYVIDVISSGETLSDQSIINDSNQLKDLKISSTQIRQWLDDFYRFKSTS